MNQRAKVVHTAKTRTAGGRENGVARSCDGRLDVRLATPGSARIGTNPLSIAIPSDLEGPLFLDMATSAVAAGKISVAVARGEPIPLGWVVDRDGKPTSDPNDLRKGGALLPLGGSEGYKGSGLAVIVEILCGLLTGLGFGQDPTGRHNDGCFMAAFNVEGDTTGDRGVVAAIELAGSGIDISTDARVNEVVSQAAQLDCPAQATRPDATPRRHVGNSHSLGADENISWIGARRKGGQNQARRLHICRNVLQAMHSDVDDTIVQRSLDGAHEHAFVPKSGNRAFLKTIGVSLNRFDLNTDVWMHLLE